jgi:hypothetical protein
MRDDGILGVPQRLFAYIRSRSAERQANNLGVIPYGRARMDLVYRDPHLEVLDAYFENRQYAHLPEWDEAYGASGYIPVRRRQPRFKGGFARSFSARVASKLVGDDVFPSFTIADDPDTTEFLKAVMKVSLLKARILEPCRRMINSGAHFIRFYIVAGAIKIESFESKYCYPVFNDGGDLESIVIKYLFDDHSDLNQHGDPKKKWFKMELGIESEILFDNPEYDPEAKEEPEFREVERVDHGLGFVQGEWLRTIELEKTPDGFAMGDDLRSFIDELNYSLSQSSQAVSYNQDPQLTIKGIDSEGVDGLIRSSMRAWNLGRDGEAKFVESSLVGVEKAKELRDNCRLVIQDTARIMLMDPEKFVGHAQSARALELLHGPMLDLIKELRPWLEVRLRSLVIKMSVAIWDSNQKGIAAPIDIPSGWSPKSLAVDATWPPVFQLTLSDLKDKVSAASSAANSRLISYETGTRYVAKDFGVEDIEAERAKIDAQPVINPFGGF